VLGSLLKLDYALRTVSTVHLQGGLDASTGETRVDMLAAELAAEARRRTEADAIVEELMQYNTAVIEQSQARAALQHLVDCPAPH
jgi:hypothetical protein